MAAPRKVLGPVRYAGAAAKSSGISGSRTAAKDHCRWASDPANPTIYRRGEMAEAEPAVPGWTMPVAELFE